MSEPPLSAPLMTELARIPTSGARAVETFAIDGHRYLVIPQLAVDVADTPANMNGGDSTAADVLVLRSAGGAAFAPFQRLPVPGGEDAEFFRIGDRAFLAVACIRAGRGPYDYARPQQIFEWVDGRFAPFQSIDGYAAKQWRHFDIGDRHFLALAQGVALPGHEQANQPSRIYEWTGERFAAYQDVDSAWGYNWAHLTIGDDHFVAYADHVRPSVLLRWDGSGFVEHQVLAERHGRAFAEIERDGERFLVVARLLENSQVLRWDGGRFVEHQDLDGPACRELLVLEVGGQLFVVRVNFITGTPAAPTTALDSQVYRWQDGRLLPTRRFATTGGTDVTGWTDPREGLLIAVSNSLGPDVRFRADTVIYRFAA